MQMWKWLEKTKSIKGDLLNFKNEPLSGISVVLLIILDIFIFTNVMIGVEGETAKVPRVSYYYPSDCSKHFKNVQTTYKGFDSYRYGHSRSAHLRPHLSEYCQGLDEKIEVFTLNEPFKSNLSLIRTIENKLRQNEQRLDQISAQYNTRLFEQIAQMPNNTELKDAKGEYDAIILDSKNLKKEKESIESVSSLEGYTAYTKYIQINKSAFKKEKESYKFWQPFKAYAHMLIFILPLLLIFGYFYRRTKLRQLSAQDYNPVVKIICAHISLILALPLFWYTLTLIYHVLPKTLLKKVIEFLVDLGLISLLNYFAIFMVVFILGGLIYWIQKRTLKHKQALVRTKDYKKLLSWSQCFECGYKIDYTKPYCQFCGVKLHKNCGSCKKEVICHEDYCSHCGDKLVSEGE